MFVRVLAVTQGYLILHAKVDVGEAHVRISTRQRTSGDPPAGLGVVEVAELVVFVIRFMSRQLYDSYVMLTLMYIMSP